MYLTSCKTRGAIREKMKGVVDGVKRPHERV
jgi:hypothetical protein